MRSSERRRLCVSTLMEERDLREAQGKGRRWRVMRHHRSAWWVTASSGWRGAISSKGDETMCHRCIATQCRSRQQQAVPDRTTNSGTYLERWKLAAIRADSWLPHIAIDQHCKRAFPIRIDRLDAHHLHRHCAKLWNLSASI